MAETPEDRVARLQAELAKAKVDQLQAELNEARQATSSGDSSTASSPSEERPSPTGGGPRSAGAKLRDRLANPSYQTFDEISGGRKPSPDTRLSDPPRKVPVLMRLLVITWSWWAIWALFMVAVAPISVWQSLENSGDNGLELALMEGFLVLVVLWLMRKTVTRWALLRRGVVAAVKGAELQSRGTYYSGVTYQNTYLAQAEGWKVTRSLYSGPSSKTAITYQVGGDTETLTLRGLPYKNGVILADSRKPSRALCVSQFPYDLDRDETGNWVGRVSPRVIVGSLAMWAVVVGWTVQAVRIYHGAGLH